MWPEQEVQIFTGCKLFMSRSDNTIGRAGITDYNLACISNLSSNSGLAAESRATYQMTFPDTK